MAQTKIKLGFYMYTPEIGGAEQHLRDLLWSLDDNRYDLTLFYQPWPAFENFLALDTLPKSLRRCQISVFEASKFLQTFRHPSRNLKRIRYFSNYYVGQYIWLKPNYQRLCSAFQAAPVEVLHIINGGYPGSFTAQLAGLAAKSAGIPVTIMTIAGTPGTRGRFPISAIEQQFNDRVGKAMDCFTVVSQEVGRILNQRFNFSTEKIKTIYYGIHPAKSDLFMLDKAQVRQELGLSTTRVLACVVARMSDEKGHIYLLEGLAQQREQFVNPVEVLLIGGGPLLPALKARAMELGLESFVKFTGPIPRPDVLKALAICDMMILPSKTEGLPYSIIEAMSLKKPVIATTVGGIPEQIIDGETGLLIPPQNATALAKAINFLVNQPDLRLQMGQKAYQRFQTYFTFEHMLREHEVLYQTLYQR